MADKLINVLVTSFPGLGLPRTLSVPAPQSMPICELRSILVSRLPAADVCYSFTTNSRREIGASAVDPISSLLPSHHDQLLPIRLSIPLRGGKGGFGSQLRAAGGRMASRKKRNQGENNGSSRNLDGRRLRTVAEAKALAEYLAIRPEMERREKELRRKKWQEVIEMAERRDEEIRHWGGKARLDGQWIEDKEEAAERTREAVQKTLCSENQANNQSLLGQDVESVDSECDDSPQNAAESRQRRVSQISRGARTQSPTTTAQTAPHFFGFDEEDEFLSDEEEESEDGLSKR